MHLSRILASMVASSTRAPIATPASATPTPPVTQTQSGTAEDGARAGRRVGRAGNERDDHLRDRSFTERERAIGRGIARRRDPNLVRARVGAERLRSSGKGHGLAVETHLRVLGRDPEANRRDARRQALRELGGFSGCVLEGLVALGRHRGGRERRVARFDEQAVGLLGVRERDARRRHRNERVRGLERRECSGGVARGELALAFGEGLSRGLFFGRARLRARSRRDGEHGERDGEGELEPRAAHQNPGSSGPACFRRGWGPGAAAGAGGGATTGGCGAIGGVAAG